MEKFAWPPVGTFLPEVFENRPLHLTGILPAGYFSPHDLDAALTASMTSELPFTIGMHGRVPPAHEYCSHVYNPMKGTSKPLIDPRKVELLLRQGANLKIQRFADVSNKVADIVASVRDWLGMAVATSANGYFSYGLQRGLPLHWDSHDILAVQLIGRKRWKIFRPATELPLRSHREDTYPPVVPDLPPDALHMDVVLEEGDVLYLPRGWWHDVTPLRGQKTLHLAVGLYPPSRHDFLLWVLNLQMLGDVELRRALLPDTPAPDFRPVLAKLSALLEQPDMLARYWQEYMAMVRPRGTFNLEPGDSRG